MKKKVWGVVLGVLMLAHTLCFGEQKLNPYQDYIFVVVHGLNDYRGSFIGKSEEFDSQKNSVRNFIQILNRWGIPKEQVFAYSFTRNRSSNLQNAMELGLRGYKPPLGGPELDHQRRINAGEAPPYLDYNNVFDLENNDLHKRRELYSYMPSLDKYFATGVEYGNCWLEQAVKDWKVSFFNSARNIVVKNGRSEFIYDSIDKIPASIVPKKYILITHSMGNLSTRLYIYSNELAKKGEQFREGFYQNDIAKVVFVAPPLEGSNVAALAAISPEVDVLFKSLDVGGQALWLYDFLTQKAKFSPMWPYEAAIWFLNKFPENDQTFKSAFGFKDPKRWNLAAQELMQNSGVVNSLRSVEMTDKQKEPSYAIVYGKGMVMPNTDNSVGMFRAATMVTDPTLYQNKASGVPVVGESMASAAGAVLSLPVLSNVSSAVAQYNQAVSGLTGSELMKNVMYLSLDKDFWGLSTNTARFLAFMKTYGTGGFVHWTKDGDGAVPVESGAGYGVKHLAKAQRYERTLKDDSMEALLGEDLPKMVVGAELARSVMLTYGLPDVFATYVTRLGVSGWLVCKVLENRKGLDKVLDAHSVMLEQQDLILKGLFDTPLITFKDSQYLASQNSLWGGVFEVTKNAQPSASAGELYQPITVTQGGETFQILRIATLNQETTSLDDPERILFNADPRGQGPDGTVGDQKLSVIATDKERLYLRGLIQDLVPKKVVAQYSMNFGGWTDLQSRIQEDGRFELGPIPLSEGQNIVAFKLRNQAGYSSNQYLKILKTGITLQPVLDELSPQPDSITNNKTIQVKLVYQNMKYSDTAANKIAIDELYVQVDPIQNPGVPTPSIPFSPTTNIIKAFPDQVRKSQPTVNNLNRLELAYTLPSLPDGRYTIIAKAHDAYNTESYLRYGFSVDRTPPRIKIFKIGVYNPHKGQR
ncbi:MAG: hypothetical protein AB7F28_04155 [Candidatus Margulisiibacteriota bacterium]